MGALSPTVKALLQLPEASTAMNVSLSDDRLMVVPANVTNSQLGGKVFVSEGYAGKEGDVSCFSE